MRVIKHHVNSILDMGSLAAQHSRMSQYARQEAFLAIPRAQSLG